MLSCCLCSLLILLSPTNCCLTSLHVWYLRVPECFPGLRRARSQYVSLSPTLPFWNHSNQILLFNRTVAQCFAENKRHKNRQIQKTEQAHHTFLDRNEPLSHLSLALCQCLNADGGHKADENCSKLNHIKGPLGLCRSVSATGDILGSKPFITLNARCGPNLPSTQRVWRGQIMTEEIQRETETEGVDES